MKHFSILISIAFILLPQSIFATDANFVGHIQVNKQTLSDNVERYTFEICILDTPCETLGQQHGYSAAAIKGLSGGWQRRAGAPALLIVEGAVGGIVAFAGGWLLAPAVTSTAVVGATFTAGAATGATTPSLTISSSSKWNWLSPAHHWETGRIKMDLEKYTRALSKISEPEASAVIYATEYETELAKLVETADQIVRVLN